MRNNMHGIGGVSLGRRNQQRRLYSECWRYFQSLRWYSTQYGDELVAIICDNDDMSSGAQGVCNDAGYPGIVCVGVDGNNYPLSMVKAGTMLATVLQDGVGQMTAGINAAIALSKGEAIEKEYSVPFVLVTAENVDEYYTGE